jgi:hypothetical protein
MYLRLDNVELTLKVEKQKAVDVLINVGGLQKSLAGIFLVFALIVSKNTF